MFTGIVQGAHPIVTICRQPGLHTLIVCLPPALLSGLNIGASVSLNGVCMTVTDIDGDRVSFDAMQETLSLTTLGALSQGERVNVERSARQGDEIGGHTLSGHVDATGELRQRILSENNCTLRVAVPAQLMKYIFKKGFIGLHGCSLTVAELDRDQATLDVCLIPETLRATNLDALCPGSPVNIEVDRHTQAIVDTVERVLAERS